MKLVMTLSASGRADVVDAQLTFHLHAGVDLVIVPDRGERVGTAELLEQYVREGYARLVREPDGSREGGRTRLARLATTDYGADWVINAGVGEFWWPRAAGLKDALASTPAQYGIVRGLVRPFLPRSGDGARFAERMTVRRSAASRGSGRERSEPGLRDVHRGDPLVEISPDDTVDTCGGLMPLRGWYPIEVFRFPDDGEGQVAPDEDEVARGLADGSLVVDTRLRDALRALPAGRLTFPVPDVVEDAAYAVECAALGEADMVRLEHRLDELEERLARLQRGLWPRMTAGVSGPSS
jgi:hypothetical protein